MAKQQQNKHRYSRLKPRGRKLSCPKMTAAESRKRARALSFGTVIESCEQTLSAEEQNTSIHLATQITELVSEEDCDLLELLYALTGLSSLLLQNAIHQGWVQERNTVN